MRRRRVFAVVLVPLALVAACGTPPEPDYEVPAAFGPEAHGPTDDTEIAAAHQAALAAWQTFPVDRKPRPLVLFSRGPNTGGFATGEAKMAAMAGNFELAAALPAAPETVTVELPDGSVMVPAITADAALDELRRDASAATAAPPVSPAPAVSTVPVVSAVPAVRIVRVELGTAPYLTDRGNQSMPTWLFHLDGGAGTVGWPAADGYAFRRWNGPLREAPLREAERRELLPFQHAKISVDGGVLTVQLLTPGRPCSDLPVYRHESVVTESPTAVVIGTRRLLVADKAPVPAGTPCESQLSWRGDEHEIRLGTPLGARVLIDEEAKPLTVTLLGHP